MAKLRNKDKKSSKLTSKEKRELLKRGQEESAKQFANKNKKGGYLNQSLIEEHKLPLATFKDIRDYFINILPKLAGEGHPTRPANESIFAFDVGAHNIKIGGKSEMICCPETTFPNLGIKCPYCEKRNEALDDGVEWKKIDDQLKVKDRELYYISFADGAEMAKGIHLMEISNFYMGKHIEKLIKPKVKLNSKKQTRGFVDIADIDDGKTLVFSVEEKTMEIGGNNVKTKALTGHQLEDREEPISDEIVDRLFDELPPLHEFVVVHTYEELYEKLNGSARESEDSVDEDENGDEISREVIEGMDEDDLLDYADDNDIELSRRDKKSESKLKAAILKWYDENNSGDGDDEDWPEDWPKRLEDIDELDDILNEKTKRQKKKFVSDTLKIDVKDMDEDDLDDEITDYYEED